MRPEDQERLRQWKKETLSEATAELAAKSAELRSGIREFNAFVSALGQKAGAGFMQVFGFTLEQELEWMDPELKNVYGPYIVSALNAALPVDYPFLVALVFSDQTPALRMCVLDRKAIPGAHELVNRDIVPVVRLKNTPLGPKHEIRLIPVDVERLNPDDNLEDLYKL